jgi:hypothetical protein
MWKVDLIDHLHCGRVFFQPYREIVWRLEGQNFLQIVEVVSSFFGHQIILCWKSFRSNDLFWNKSFLPAHLKLPCSKSLACWKIFVLEFSCCEKTNFLYNNTKIRVETTQIFVLWKIFYTKFTVFQHKNFNTNIFQHASDFEHGNFKCATYFLVTCNSKVVSVKYMLSLTFRSEQSLAKWFWFILPKRQLAEWHLILFKLHLTKCLLTACHLTERSFEFNRKIISTKV